MAARWGALDGETASAAEALVAELGRPDLGVVLGSGWEGFGDAIGAGRPVPRSRIPGFPACRVAGHDGGVRGLAIADRRLWLVTGRVHAYEGRSSAEVAFPVRLLAAAGARGVVLTCAAGGLGDDDRPGDLAVVADHLNLQGADPIGEIPAELREPAFLDLHGVYDEGWRAILGEVLRAHGSRARDGILASVRGPCYETPAEVRMLRALGADLVSMSTVAEAVAARYEGLMVAAIACVSNRGAGLGGEPIGHAGVLDVVRASIAEIARGLAAALARLPIPRDAAGG